MADISPQIPPFGYVKDEQDKDRWLIDEEAAKTVRYIFKLCCDGLGPTQIANRLRWEQVLTPTAYKAQQRGELLPERPFHWAQKTVSGILDKVEYLGHTENFKTASKNYRSNTGTCTAHLIRAVTLEKIVLAHMKRVLAYVQQFETAFVKREREKTNLQTPELRGKD